MQVSNKNSPVKDNNNTTTINLSDTDSDIMNVRQNNCSNLLIHPYKMMCSMWVNTSVCDLFCTGAVYGVFRRLSTLFHHGTKKTETNVKKILFLIRIDLAAVKRLAPLPVDHPRLIDEDCSIMYIMDHVKINP